MTEILSSTEEEIVNPMRVLSNRLIFGYFGRVDLGLAFVEAEKIDNKFSVYNILAENYPLLPSSLQNEIKEHSAIAIQRKAALSLAQTGDLSLVNKILEKKQNYADADNEIKWLVDAAKLQAQNNVDNSATYRKAFNLIQENERSRNGKYYDQIGHYGLVVESMFESNQDTTSYLETMRNIIEQKKADKKISDSEISQYVKTLAFCERYDEALSSIQGLLSPSEKAYQNQILYEKATRHLQKSEVEEALKTARLIVDPPHYLTILNNVLKFQIENKQDTSDTATEAERLMGFSAKGKQITDTLVILAQAAKLQGKDYRIYKDKLSKIAENASIYDLTTLARFKKELGEDIKPLFDSIKDEVEHLYSKAHGDKLEYIEAVMYAEDAIFAAIDLGCYDVARELIELYMVKDSNAPEEAGHSDMTAEIYARLAVAELKEGIKDEELQDITQMSLQGLIKINNHQLHEALGYFDLLNEESLKYLRPGMYTSVLMGKMQRTGKPTENQELTDQALISLRVNLQQELSRDPNSPEVRRLMKSLIELKDEEGRRAAAELVTNEQVSSHIRLYWARKLCDSGFWDREIIFYFRTYEAKADQEALLRDVRLESLSAIINQMHQTPTLALYKVYEKTRLAKDRQALDIISDLGNSVFLLPTLDMKQKLAVFGYWSERFEKGLIDEQEMYQLKDNLAKLSEAEKRFLLIHGIAPDKATYEKANVQTLYSAEAISGYFEEVAKLLKVGIFPTPILIEFLVNNAESGIEWLRLLKIATEDGRFDPNNLVQRDLEFTKYLSLFKAKLKGAYENFSKLDPQKGKEIIFTETGLNYVKKK